MLMHNQGAKAIRSPGNISETVCGCGIVPGLWYVTGQIEKPVSASLGSICQHFNTWSDEEIMRERQCVAEDKNTKFDVVVPEILKHGKRTVLSAIVKHKKREDDNKHTHLLVWPQLLQDLTAYTVIWSRPQLENTHNGPSYCRARSHSDTQSHDFLAHTHTSALLVCANTSQHFTWFVQANMQTPHHYVAGIACAICCTLS